MATTFPSEFPEHLIADREPEKRVFDALSSLPDGYIVILGASKAGDAVFLVQGNVRKAFRLEY